MASELWKICAVPWKAPCTVSGTLSSRRILSICSTASLSAAPGARLKDSVTAGKTPWWLMVSGETLLTKLATVLSGTCMPLAAET